MSRIMMVFAVVALLTVAATQAVGQTDQSFTPLPTGTRVDVFSSPGVGQGRGKIVGAPDAAGKYKVRMDGCTAAFDQRVDHSLVARASTLSRTSAVLRPLFGRWAVFTPSYPAAVVKDPKTRRDYARGKKPAPLTLRANGHFVWYYDYGHRPVRGRWTTDAALPSGPGIYQRGGVVIKDPRGHPWKVYARKRTGGKAQVSVQRFCSGVTDIGTKV
jgi:hypothetical protein